MKRLVSPSEYVNCPFMPNTSEVEGGFLPCKKDGCMAWLVINPRIEMSSTSSGAKQFMANKAANRGQVAKETWPAHHRKGIITIEEQATCVRLYPVLPTNEVK